MTNNKPVIQGSLFEEDYLIRTLGNLGSSPETALTELVANAWDAGATNVDIFIPEDKGDKLTIIDNGIGMTKEEFYARWMKLGYNRLKHQGKKVEFPKGVNLQRVAYGRNGIGRHGMLCFNNEYVVITSKNGNESRFTISTKSEKEPFLITKEQITKSTKTGTRLEVVVAKNLPNSELILDIISARFLHDPEFVISINKQTLQLEQHKGLIDSEKLDVGKVHSRVHLIDSRKSRKSTIYQGIAIWQGGRLVGEPNWIVGKNMVLDGRSKQAKRYSVVVETNDLTEYIKDDWSGLIQNKDLDEFYEKLSACIQNMFVKIAKENIEETTNQIKREHKKDYEELSPLARYEVDEAIHNISITNPTARQESISLAVETIIQLEKTRSGSQLLQKLANLSSEDVEGLNKILENWTVKDALTVLDEIDQRISVIEAIRKLSSDKKVDELHVLHPLVASARWIFGPEFDSPEFSSNSQLHTTIEKVFGKKIDKDSFENYKRRPDIVAIGDSVFSITSTLDYDAETGMSPLKKVLIIELKRGGYKLGRKERDQAVGYVEDFLSSGTLLGNPFVNAFVVGESFDSKLQPTHTVENENRVKVGQIQICLFSQIVDSAEKRLFNLRSRLSERYADVSGIDLFERQRKLAI